MKRITAYVLALVLACSCAVSMAGAYTDVPGGSALAGEVEKAVSYGLMNGYSQDRFGYSDAMTRAQFVVVLTRMMGWQTLSDEETAASITAAMALPKNLSSQYRSAIACAAAHDVIGQTEAFRPNSPATRAEMAEMLVRALGLKSCAADAEKENSLPFTDVSDKKGYIAVAYEIGMTKGLTDTTFAPDRTATRAQAAAMLVRIYEKLHQQSPFVHGFYAISSYSQLSLAKSMDAVSAGWSRMTWDGTAAVLNTTEQGGNEYRIPSGYEEVAAGIAHLNLSVFMDGQELKELLASESGRAQAVQQIVQELSRVYDKTGGNPYEGVTIDFEGLRASQKEAFSNFLRQLQAALQKLDKQLFVCVPPVLTSSAYYDGYDCQVIGELADKVILMAYGYGPQNMNGFIGTEYYKTAATAPIASVYTALRQAASEIPPAKLLLGFSVINTAWKIDENGKLLSETPVYPSTETVIKRLSQSDTKRGWSQTYQQSYAIYRTEDGSRYFLWYQDDASVQQALSAARLLGVNGVSIWRLGTIPTANTAWTWNGLLA